VPDQVQCNSSRNLFQQSPRRLCCQLQPLVLRKLHHSLAVPGTTGAIYFCFNGFKATFGFFACGRKNGMYSLRRNSQNGIQPSRMRPEANERLGDHALYFIASLRHYFILREMNRSSTRAVLPIYKEGQPLLLT